MVLRFSGDERHEQIISTETVEQMISRETVKFNAKTLNLVFFSDLVNFFVNIVIFAKKLAALLIIAKKVAYHVSLHIDDVIMTAKSDFCSLPKFCAVCGMLRHIGHTH